MISELDFSVIDQYYMLLREMGEGWFCFCIWKILLPKTFSSFVARDELFYFELFLVHTLQMFLLVNLLQKPFRLEGTSAGLSFNLLPKAGLAMRLDHIAQGFMQPGPEIPQGLRLHNVLETEPLPDCPNGEFPPSIPILICGCCLSAMFLPSYLF